MATTSNNMAKHLTVFLQVCIYERASVLPFLMESLPTLFGETGTWAAAGIFRGGIKKITGKNSIVDCLGNVNKAFPQGFNELEITGKNWNWPHERSALSATIVLRPSPLNKDWASVGEIQSDEHTRPVLRRLWSIQSHEGYVLVNKLKRDPVFISIAVRYPAESKGSTRKIIMNEFGGFVQQIGSKFQRGYIGFIDPLEMPPVHDIMGGRPERSVRMDLQFDRPHMIIFGPESVVSRFHNDVVSEYPKIDLVTEAIGGCRVVAFKDRGELEQVDLPKWHVLHP